MNIGQAIAELRSLNQPPPKPRRLPTEDEVKATERRLGIEFPADYRRYLLEASDVNYSTIEPCVITSGPGFRDLVTTATAAWQLGVPRDWLPICGDNGDYYCLDGNVVRFWSHNGVTDEHWADLGTWIVEVWIGESG